MARKKGSLLPGDIPLWFATFARHVLVQCAQPGRYEIRLEVPSADDQLREVTIWRMERLQLALFDNAERRRIQHDKLRLMD